MKTGPNWEEMTKGRVHPYRSFVSLVSVCGLRIRDEAVHQRLSKLTNKKGKDMKVKANKTRNPGRN